MNEVYISPALRSLSRLIDEVFGEALEEIAEDVAEGWRGEIIGVDLIDTGNYLHAVRPTYSVQSGDERTVMVEAPEAAGYAAAIKRKGESGYIGRRVAGEGIRRAGPQIKERLDRAGKRLKG